MVYIILGVKCNICDTLKQDSIYILFGWLISLYIGCAHIYSTHGHIMYSITRIMHIVIQ